MIRPRALRRLGLLAAVPLVAAGVAVTSSAPARAVPVLGEPGLVALACRFPDDPGRNRTLGQLDTLVRGPAPSLDSWVRQTSRGHADLASAQVRGWFVLSLTLASRPSTPAVARDCRAQAEAAGVTIPTTAMVLSVVNTGPYLPATTEPYGTVIRADAPLAAWTHQLGHLLGLRDAWSLDPATGDYRRGDDEYSVMGNWADPFPAWAPLHVVPLGVNGFHRGLGAYELDRLSWLDERKIFTVGADGRGAVQVPLSPTDSVTPAGLRTGYELIRVPADPADPEHYYTVEYRMAQNSGVLWVPSGPYQDVEQGIVVHEVRGGVPILIRDDSRPIAYEPDVTPARPMNHGRDPRTVLTLGNVTINTGDQASTAPARSFDDYPYDPAYITVTTTVTPRCATGFVPRRADRFDGVCVTPDRATATATWNQGAASRWANGPDGPRTCLSGYVWREAWPNDKTCVSPAERSTVAAENRTATSRMDGATATRGPNWCTSGYVWREADGYDHVCTTPERRAAVAAEQDHSWPCPAPLVPRTAWADDRTCVTVASALVTALENASAAGRVRPGG